MSPNKLFDEEEENYKWPDFGNHAGKLFKDIPRDYLEWFYRECNDPEKHEELLELIEEYLNEVNF
jgi:uncharacterized protein (DUF3820 family)